ncbi:MAG: peptidyl-prolyl cis-trans isomerase [Bdellovibrio sp.]|nr:peptidyl-prolyl cis-trans isomerase [Bdellovibrio sp.]
MNALKKYHAAHILVKHAYEAEDLIKKLAEGKSFEELATKFSNCQSAKNQGDLGQIAFGKADPDFEEAVELLKPGQITKKPIRSRFGFHIIKRIS